MENDPYQNNTTPNAPAENQTVEPIQNQAIAEPVTQEVRPSLVRRLHLKLFTLLLSIVLLIFAVLYYQSHPLPEFISSQADKLPSLLNSSRTLRSSTIIDSQNGSSSGSTTQMIVESVGRSETTYRLVSSVAGQGADLTQTVQAIQTSVLNTPVSAGTPSSCVPQGGAALSTRDEDANCCAGLHVLAQSCPDSQGPWQGSNGCDPEPICM